MLLLCCIVTGVSFAISMMLNFTRCLFIDLVVAFSFFGNIYIWRNFNIFLGLKLIFVIGASVFIDVFWEIMRIVHFSKKYEPTLRAIRL